MLGYVCGSAGADEGVDLCERVLIPFEGCCVPDELVEVPKETFLYLSCGPRLDEVEVEFACVPAEAAVFSLAVCGTHAGFVAVRSAVPVSRVCCAGAAESFWKRILGEMQWMVCSFRVGSKPFKSERDSGYHGYHRLPLGGNFQILTNKGMQGPFIY
jgi:hypothetical protein